MSVAINLALCALCESLKNRDTTITCTVLRSEGVVSRIKGESDRWTPTCNSTTTETNDHSLHSSTAQPTAASPSSARAFRIMPVSMYAVRAGTRPLATQRAHSKTRSWRVAACPVTPVPWRLIRPTMHVGTFLRIPKKCHVSRTNKKKCKNQKRGVRCFRAFRACYRAGSRA